MAASTPTDSPEAPPEDYEWTEFGSSGRGHLIEKEGAERPIPQADGSVEVRTMTLCGNIAADTADTGEFRQFKGFSGHRNIEWCQMCKHLYDQHNGGDGLFGI